MRFSSVLGIAAAILMSASPSTAQDSTVPEHLVGMVGDWRLEQEDQSLPACGLKFAEDESVGGWVVEVPEPCPAPFPPVDSLVAWNVDESDGSVIVLDAERNVVLRLFEDEDGLFVTAEGIEPRFYLMLPYDEDGTGGEAGD